MATAEHNQASEFRFRARLPRNIGIGALVLLVVVVLGLLVGFYRSSGNTEFRMKGLPASLSRDVLAVVEGYERREVEGDTLKYYIKADRATTFTDEHQELENVTLRVYSADGLSNDEITANKAIYIPAPERNFKAFFAGDVNISTRDSLILETSQLTYDHASGTATAEEQINFQRANITGSALGATVNATAKTTELLRDVKIVISGDAGSANGGRESTLNAGYAAYDQGRQMIEFRDNFEVISANGSAAGTVRIKGGRGSALLSNARENELAIAKVELFEEVEIVSAPADERSTRIRSGYASVDRVKGLYELRDRVEIASSNPKGELTARSDTAVYDEPGLTIKLTGSSDVAQGNELVKGDEVTASLFPNRKLRTATANGSAYLRQAGRERTLEISASELKASFDESESIVAANAAGNVNASLTPNKGTGFSNVRIITSRAIAADFGNNDAIKQIRTDGRTTIELNVPDGNENASNKRVTADSVRTSFAADGKNLAKAEASGNAELNIEPLRPHAQNYRTTVHAPRFDCEFFATGNNARTCIASRRARAIREPTVSREGRGRQTITAEILTADFSETTRDIERLKANGAAKFIELDRNAISDSFDYAAADETVRLRGGEPTAWDSRARARAREIDWNLREHRSFLRGAVGTTYYSQRATGGAAPFGSSEKPVFVTSNAAEIDHRSETAKFTGNARAWQGSNYVRAESLLIRQKDGELVAEGGVQSLLYDVRRTAGGRSSSAPVFASSTRMTYSRDNRLLRYEQQVSIKQEKDHLQGEVAIVHLSEENDVLRTDIEKNVVVTQPGRKATGDFAQYTATDERVLLRGEPALVSDDRNGETRGTELVIFLRENRIVGEGRSPKDSSGRVRSVYKIQND